MNEVVSLGTGGLPPGWSLPAGSVWLVGAFEFETAEAAAACLTRLGTLQAIRGAGRLAVRLEDRLLVLRTPLRAGDGTGESDRAFAGVIGNAAAEAGGLPLESFAGERSPAADRPPEAVQSALRRIIAEVLRLEGTIEELAAEADAQAGMAPAGEAPSVLWHYLKASLPQLLADNFGPLVSELRTTASVEPRQLRGEELVI